MNFNFNVVTEFENKISEFFGSPYAVAVDSCTHGIELCLRYTKEKKINVPKRTYLSVPFLSDKMGLEREWRDEEWVDYYILTYGNKEAIQDRKENRKERVKDVTAKDNSVGEFLAKDAAKRAREYQIEDDKIKGLAKSYENFANMLASDVTNGLMNVFTALEEGKNPLDAIGQMFINIAKNIAAAIIQATIFQAILTAFPELRAVFKASGILTSAFGYSGPRATGGITNGPSMALVGEAGPEAIMPLSKLSNFLNTSFNAGAMSSGGTGNGSQFVLRGQDLLLSINRAQKASNLKGQNISLG